MKTSSLLLSEPLTFLYQVRTCFEKSCKELGVEFMYLGTSYESNSVKKADYPGFQWWTGRMWSSDRDEYVRLCHEETKAKTLIDISDLQFQYFTPRKNT